MQSRRGGERRTEPFDPGGTEKKPLEKNKGSSEKDEASNGGRCEVCFVRLKWYSP